MIKIIASIFAGLTLLLSIYSFLTQNTDVLQYSIFFLGGMFLFFGIYEITVSKENPLSYRNILSYISILISVFIFWGIIQNNIL